MTEQTTHHQTATPVHHEPKPAEAVSAPVVSAPYAGAAIQPSGTKQCEVLGILAIVFSVVAFIPIIGRMFLVAALILGIISVVRGKKQAVCGIIGLVLGILVLITKIIMLVAVFIAGSKGIEMAMAEMPKAIADENLPQTVRYIEEYKTTYGNYPELLADLQEISEEAFGTTIDPMGAKDIIKKAFNGEMNEDNALELMPQYYYELQGDGYILFSNGADQLPFTEDDILPNSANLPVENGLQVAN